MEYSNWVDNIVGLHTGSYIMLNAKSEVQTLINTGVNTETFSIE